MEEKLKDKRFVRTTDTTEQGEAFNKAVLECDLMMNVGFINKKIDEINNKRESHIWHE